MSQRSQSIRRYSLIPLVLVFLGLSAVLTGCGSARQVAKPVDPSSVVGAGHTDSSVVASATGERSGEDILQDLSQEGKSAVREDAKNDDLMALDSLDDIYSSFTEEREQEERRKAIEAGTIVPESLPPLEYVSHITGGYEAAEVELPRWLAGGKQVRFIDPAHMVKLGARYFIVDTGHESLFMYDESRKALMPVINISQYFVGDPGDIIRTNDGYFFVSDPSGKRVLKFNKEYKLVAIFKDAMNLAQPQRLYYDEMGQRLFVSDGVFSRILVFNALGTPLYSIGQRGEEPGQFISLTDFMVSDDKIYVTDSVGIRAQVMSIEGQAISQFGEDDLVMPLAIAMDKFGRIYIADRDDDLIKVFEDGALRWKIGGSGVAPGRFKEINEMNIIDDHLYVVERINRRIQIFRVVPPAGMQ